MFNIVTFICVDEKKEDSKVKYDQMIHVSGEERRLSYWKCVFTFFCTSMRVNPERPHKLFTNDRNDVIINGVDIKSKLTDLGVDVIILPFLEFNPDGKTNRFKNAFYKFEVLKSLGEEGKASIVLDSDCLWIQQNKEFEKLIESDQLLLYDIYQREDRPYQKGSHNLSMKDMGETFRNIDPSYPTDTPIWYGGEIIAGNSFILKNVAQHHLDIFNFLLRKSDSDKLYKFKNGKSVLSGNEALSSFVFNSGKYQIKHVNNFIKRIWTYPDVNNVKKEDLDLAIWHLIGEKRTGLNLLFNEAANPKSKFWKIEIPKFKYYIGEYCGIPSRKHGRFNPLLIERFIKGKIKQYILNSNS